MKGFVHEEFLLSGVKNCFSGFFCLKAVFKTSADSSPRRDFEKSMKQLMTIIIRPRKTEISRGYQHQSICFEAFIADGGESGGGGKKNCK